MSLRKLAKAFLFHTRRAHVRSLAAPRSMPWVRRQLNLPPNQIFDPLHSSTDERARVTLLDVGATFHRPMPSLPDAPLCALQFFSNRAVESTAPTYVAELRNGVAWGHPTGGVFVADGRFAPAFTHDPSGPAAHTIWTRLRLPPPQPLAGRTLYLVTPEATDNFHHWLIDLLPRIGLVRRAGYRLQDFDHVIVNHSRRRYQLSTLAHLGIAPEKIIAASEAVLVRCEQLVVPSLKPNHQAIPAADIAFLRNAFLDPNAATHSPRRPRRFFLSRADADFRRLVDEQRLYPRLEKLGFEIFTPGSRSLSEQATCFAEAELIVGPAGAAFANLVFAQRPARVIEITPPGWLSAFHWMISARLGLPHTVLLGEGALMTGVPDSSARQKDIHLKEEKLFSLLPSVSPVTPEPQPASR
jgi:capsular polysaccharide biosynthesis protein